MREILGFIFKKRYTELVERSGSDRVTHVINGTERRKDGKIERFSASHHIQKSGDERIVSWKISKLFH
jgi:hypothetical protein